MIMGMRLTEYNESESWKLNDDMNVCYQTTNVLHNFSFISNPEHLTFWLYICCNSQLTVATTNTWDKVPSWLNYVTESI